MRMSTGTLLSPRGTTGSTEPVPLSTSGTPAPPSPTAPPAWRRWIWPGLLVITALLFFVPLSIGSTPQTLTYTAFVDDVTANKVATAVIDDTGAVTGTLVGGATYISNVPTALDNAGLSQQLLDHKVAVTGTAASPNVLLDVVISFLPYLIMIALAIWWLRRSVKQAGSGGGGLGGLMGVGRSRAKLYDQDKPATRFSDIAGYEGAKAEVMEVVDLLKNPERYARAGAVGPKGVLMIGPPGTGKTLLARAVAGEAGVPFFALSGSSFVEMFVGVGASRVRSLFEDARKGSPSIIFIDEIDAIGGHRGHGGFGSNDEREQTLNQLLSEMDGFEAGSSVVVIAATNRAEILDAALLRPGRFDRTVEIPLPSQRERTEILTIHARGKVLAPDVDLDRVSRGTPGFAGADLANLINEAAINAVRGHRDVLTASDFDAARERLLIGRRDSTNALLPAEKDAVAVHEAGHALVAVLSEHADPVAKVTILPRGSALGVTEQLPESERHLYPESYLKDSLAVRLGGRAAEILRPGGGVHRRGERPRVGHRAGHAHGARLGPLPGARTDRLQHGRHPTGQPLRRTPVRRGHPASHRPRGRPPAHRGGDDRGRAARHPPGDARRAGHRAARPGDDRRSRPRGRPRPTRATTRQGTRLDPRNRRHGTGRATAGVTAHPSTDHPMDTDHSAQGRGPDDLVDTGPVAPRGGPSVLVAVEQTGRARALARELGAACTSSLPHSRLTAERQEPGLPWNSGSLSTTGRDRRLAMDTHGEPIVMTPSWDPSQSEWQMYDTLHGTAPDWAPPSLEGPPPHPASDPGASRRRHRIAAGAAGALVVATVAAGVGITSSARTAAAGAGSSTPASGGGVSQPPTGTGGTGATHLGFVPGAPQAPRSSRPAAVTATKVTSGKATAAQEVGVVDITTTLAAGGEAAATGMILTPTGEVLTNNHVVDGATSISGRVVRTGATYQASVVGYDATQDVAVIQLSGASGLATVSTSTSAAYVGESVVGVGNAGGTGGTPSAATGSITALGASITASEQGSAAEHLTGMLVTNAPIKPGDSGGPMYDSSGRAIAMDTAGAAGGPSVAFAIPMSRALSVAAAIEAGQASSTIHIGATAFLGVEVAGSSRAVVVGVLVGSPVARAGLTAGDVITSLAGQRITTPASLSVVMKSLTAGQRVSLHWTDVNGRTHSASVTLMSGPAA